MNDDVVLVAPPGHRAHGARTAGQARAAAADRRRGARGGGQVSGVLRRADREPAHARGVRAGRGAVPGVVRGAGPQKTPSGLVSPPVAPASLTPGSARWWRPSGIAVARRGGRGIHVESLAAPVRRPGVGVHRPAVVAGRPW